MDCRFVLSGNHWHAWRTSSRTHPWWTGLHPAWYPARLTSASRDYASRLFSLSGLCNRTYPAVQGRWWLYLSPSPATGVLGLTGCTVSTFDVERARTGETIRITMNYSLGHSCCTGGALLRLLPFCLWRRASRGHPMGQPACLTRFAPT